jgi:DNA end-binding protein Ku
MDNLQALIDAKVAGKEVVTPPAAEPAKVIDIMQALKQSLAAAKKPPASVETLNVEPEKKTATKKRSARG